MEQGGADLTFEEWVRYVFDNPPGYAWFDQLADWGTIAPATMVAYLGRLCAEAGTRLAPYADAQVAQSFWFLAGGGTGALDALLDEGVPWPARQVALRAIGALFTDCFAPRCGPFLSHLDEDSDHPLNGLCYMWWDLFPTWGHPALQSQARVDAEVLALLAQILTVPSDACRESALHGLGHWAAAYPGSVDAIIDAWLRAQPVLRPELRRYAECARRGCVL
jgi:hypothetical protein